MKICYFDDFKLGIVKGDNVVDVTAVVKDIPHTGPHNLISGLIERFDAYRGKLEAAVAKEAGVPLKSVRFRSPLPRPYNIDCMAVNYMEDGTRSEPAPINAFHKSPSCVIGDGDTMVLEDIPATIFEGEAELALVIGTRATNVKAADALKVNGIVKQNFNTDDMAHKIPRCIEWVSSIHTLEPGDVLATGTNHRGLNAFMDGDKVELECAGLGVLHINVRDDLKRTWSRDTRLEHANKGLPGVQTPQLTGKYAPAKK